MPVADDFRPRLDLIPKVTNNGAGGGQFALVQQTYRKCRKADKRTPIMVWVDADIYVRNEGVVEERNAKNYSGKKNLPEFLFSVMNFEDFLALHFDDDIFEKWYEAFSPQHFKVPMHGSQHMPIFVKIWQEHANNGFSGLWNCMALCRTFDPGDSERIGNI